MKDKHIQPSGWLLIGYRLIANSTITDTSTRRKKVTIEVDSREKQVIGWKEQLH
jgi:hypothetical protein